MGEVLQEAGILNLPNNTKYFFYSYYLLFLLSKLKETKVNLFPHYEYTPLFNWNQEPEATRQRVHDYIFPEFI